MRIKSVIAACAILAATLGTTVAPVEARPMMHHHRGMMMRHHMHHRMHHRMMRHRMMHRMMRHRM